MGKIIYLLLVTDWCFSVVVVVDRWRDVSFSMDRLSFSKESKAKRRQVAHHERGIGYVRLCCAQNI